MALTFRGGIHPDEHKNTRSFPVVRMPSCAKVSIPLSQHIGAHCKPTVKIGDLVDKGQTIGEVESGLGCPVHSSVSGKVVAIETKSTASGVKVQNVVIESDGEERLSPDIKESGRVLSETSQEEIVEIVRMAGISGMGGATFPTYAKISSAIGKAQTLVVNCAECEPYITANHRLLLENPAAVINGTKILMKATGVKEAVIALEDNKKDTLRKLKTLTADSQFINIQLLKTKYPQGDERQIIYALTGKELPMGKLPADLGFVVFNAETCAAVYMAFSQNMPLVERIVTVDGDCIAKPKNVLVPLGTQYVDLINFCGGLTKEPEKIINGGPMMGAAQWDITSAVTKGTSALLVFSKDCVITYSQPKNCIRCGRCVRGCPMRLMPNYLQAYAKKADYDTCRSFNIMSCVECGTCSYQCPAFIPIVQYIRDAKFKINEEDRAKSAAQKKTADNRA